MSYLGAITSMLSKDGKFYELIYQGGESAKLSILSDHVIRLHMSPDGAFREPTPSYENKGLTMIVKNVDEIYKLDAFNQSLLKSEQDYYYVETSKIIIALHKQNGKMTVTHKETNTKVIEEVKPLSHHNSNTTQELVQQKDEYFFGSGMHTGIFNHKGKTIDIKNDMSKTYAFGEVLTAIPFYWSTNYYGVFRNTWEEGVYDFSDASKVTTTHKSKDFDAFYFVSGKPENILHDYFELTGAPLLMPEYALYGAYLRPVFKQHWVVDTKCDKDSAQDEHGTCYKKSWRKTDIPEDCNGDYPFSAKGWVNRFKKEDIPLGWIIISDNEFTYDKIEELKKLIDYTSENVKVGVWYRERYVKDEIEAGVVTFFTNYMKTPILHMMENVSNALEKNNVRPMNCGLNGCAGIQRCSGLMSGYWTYNWDIMKFHIPTYISMGLSGVPVVGSDVNGTFGKIIMKKVYIRDYQWKSFTPLQLIIDCCTHFDNAPFSLDEEATKINRAYLKLKSMLMPYNYTISHESISGLPMVRAMFLQFPDDVKYTQDCQYQFMWGQYFLIAPIYNDMESSGYSLRNGIYLPDQNQVWIDFFTGEKYQGGKVINELKVPLWKLPVFVKDGAIIPCVWSNNNPNDIKRDTRIILIYPNGKENFTIYEDDGISLDYKNKNEHAETLIEVEGPKSNEKGKLIIKINKTKGNYKGIEPDRLTIINIMSSKDIKAIKVDFNDSKSIQLYKIYSLREFCHKENVYIFDKNYTANPYLKELTEQIKQSFISIKLEKVPVSDTEIKITIGDFQNKSKTFGSDLVEHIKLETPKNLTADSKKTTHHSITLNWETVEDAEYYEICRDELIFSHIDIATTNFEFEDLNPKTKYRFKIRSMKDDRVSRWSDQVTETTQ